MVSIPICLILYYSGRIKRGSSNQHPPHSGLSNKHLIKQIVSGKRQTSHSSSRLRCIEQIPGNYPDYLHRGAEEEGMMVITAENK